jgi:serine protease AprX
MKNCKLNKGLMLLSLTLFGWNAYSQTPAQRAEIVKNYDTEALKVLSEKFAKEQAENYQLALAEAKKRNLPLVIEDENNYAELVGIAEDGSLLYNTTYNQGSAITARANALYPNGSLGLNVQGQEMNVGVWDANHPRLSHSDFNDRAFVLDGSGVNQTQHSTHVTGTIISSGTNNLEGRGLAPMAYAWVNDWTNDISEMGQQAGFGLIISNHSYGLIAGQLSLVFFGGYTTLARNVDEVTFAAPFYLPVFAAGNDRDSWGEINPGKNQNDLITARSASKNGITVAAVGNVSNYVNASSVSMSSFSNYGPMDDFRIKPDISAKGVNVLSTSSQNNSSYATLSGTSMAAPAISAVLALLQQHYNNKNAVFMRSATAKGLILHTADEAGPAEGPDHMFGWGLVNARAAAQIITNTTVSSLILENTLQQGQSFTRTVYSAGNQPLQASISWTDRPGTANNNVVDLATPSLVNDLDIRITRNNETFLPWRLTSNFNAPVAVRADNNIDPFEKIQIANPSAGTYTITVTHKNNLVGASQNYSLIVSGIDETLSNDSFTDSNAIKVYPNPSTQFLTISNIIDKGVSNINVYDLNGRLIEGVNLVPNSVNDYTLSTQDFNEGLYILKIEFINGEISYHKFLKRN